MNKTISIIEAIIIGVLLVFVGYLYFFSKTVTQTTGTQSLNTTSVNTTTKNINDAEVQLTQVKTSPAKDTVVYGDGVVKDGNAEYRSFIMTLPVGNNTLETQGEVTYGGIENINTGEKYLMLDASRLEDLVVLAIRGSVALVYKCYGSHCAGLYRVDLDKRQRAGKEVYFVNSYLDIRPGEFDKILEFKDKLIIVGQKEIAEYNILSRGTRILVTLRENETFGSYGSIGGGGIVPEARLDGNVLRYSVYQDMDKSANPFGTIQKEPLLNKSIILE